MSESEKEETKNTEEESQSPEIKREAEEAEKVEAEVKAKETAAEKEAKPEKPSSPKKHDTSEKGLMERRESFDQASVPNAHKGYSGKHSIVMLLVVVAMFIVSYILAAMTG